MSHKTLRKLAHTLTAQGQRAASNDPDLAAVIEAWDGIPEGVRQSVVMLVKAAAGKGE
jgi:hypothetical protein